MLGSNQPMFVAWGPHRTLIYNDAYAEILAAKHPAALGGDFLDVWREIQADLVPIVNKAYSGAPVHMDDIELVMHRRGYPEETHFSFFYAPVRDEDGEVAGLYCACTEITGQVLGERHRREAEAALITERDRTRRVLDGMAEGFALLDREFRFIDINAEGLRLEDRLRDEIIGKTQWEAWPGSEESELGRLYKHAMAQCIPVSHEHRYRWPDGREAWLEMRAYPTEDGLAIFWRDVSDRKRAEMERETAEAELRESEARFRVMADAVPQIVWITDADGRAEFFNRQWAAYVGSPEFPLSAGEVAARHVHPDDEAQTMAAFEEARRVGGAFEVEHRMRRWDGAYRWFLVRAEPFRDAKTGEILRWFGSSTDIHDRKMFEARLRELNSTLEQQVAERTAERDRMWDTSPDLMLVIDFEGYFRRVNSAWSALLGYEPDELIGRHVNEFVVPEDHGDTVRAYEAAAAGERLAIENRYRHKDGSIREISWVAAPAGNLAYATGRDVTVEKTRLAELAAAEAARREADALYRAYFENTPEALFVIGIDCDGAFVVEEINPAHEAGIGFKPIAMWSRQARSISIETFSSSRASRSTGMRPYCRFETRRGTSCVSSARAETSRARWSPRTRCARARRWRRWASSPAASRTTLTIC
jgi:PAS domain S-box-containing protein